MPSTRDTLGARIEALGLKLRTSIKATTNTTSSQKSTYRSDLPDRNTFNPGTTTYVAALVNAAGATVYTGTSSVGELEAIANALSQVET